MALDGVPLEHEIHIMPLVGHTMPVELVTRSGAQSRAVRAAVAIARELHAGAAQLPFTPRG